MTKTTISKNNTTSALVMTGPGTWAILEINSAEYNAAIAWQLSR